MSIIRKWKSILAIVAMLLVMMAVGYVYGYYQKSDREINNGNERLDLSRLALADKESGEEEESAEIAISPVCDIILTKAYLRCNEVVVEKRKPYKEEIGIDIKGIQSLFPEWDVEEFSDTQVVLRKEIDNYCSNHYILGEKGGLVTIFVPSDEDKGMEVLSQTSIKVHNLPKALQEEIEDGMVVDSLEQVEHLMESWES